MTRVRDRSRLPRFIGDIDTSRQYPIEELMQMFYDGKLTGGRMDGWVVQADADTGMISFVPWWEGHMTRSSEGRLRSAEIDAEAMRQDVEREHPMRRRTPQQRTAAMMVRLMGEAAKTGTIPGFSPEQIRTIVGESWKAGEPLAAEDVKRVAAHFLGQAQAANREADSHRTTRAHQYA